MLHVGATVTVVVAGAALEVVPATVVGAHGGTARLELEREVAVGSRVILELRDQPETPRMAARVVGQQGRSVDVEIDRVVRKDAREYPRQVGRIALRYRPASGDDAAWLRGDEAPGEYRELDALMNFSVTGLAFEDVPPDPSVDLLQVAFSVPGSPTWRATARIVRVIPIPDDEREPGDATHRIAVLFESIPSEATHALLAYTARLQQV